MLLKNLYQDYITKDLVLDNKFNLRWTSNLAEFISQKIENVLQFVLGEYWLNITLGIDFYNSVLIKNPDINYINSLFAREITNRIPEISSLNYLTTFFNTEERVYTIEYKFTANEQVTNGSVNIII